MAGALSFCQIWKEFLESMNMDLKDYPILSASLENVLPWITLTRGHRPFTLENVTKIFEFSKFFDLCQGDMGTRGHKLQKMVTPFFPSRTRGHGDTAKFSQRQQIFLVGVVCIFGFENWSFEKVGNRQRSWRHYDVISQQAQWARQRHAKRYDVTIPPAGLISVHKVPFLKEKFALFLRWDPPRIARRTSIESSADTSK